MKKQATTYPMQASYNPAFTGFISARPPQTGTREPEDEGKPAHTRIGSKANPFVFV
jgi:hypothetical protein